MSAMEFIIALDQGTTSSRAIVFDHKGVIVATAQKEFRQIYPKPGWVEHDANEIWQSQREVTEEVVRKAKVDRSRIAGIGITNQRETTIVWKRKTGEPICNAIVWQDRRTAGMFDKLRADGYEDTFRKKTGLVIDAYFSGTKLAWILDNIDGARKLAERGELAFGTVDSWLAFKLTDGKLHITDASNASRTLLFNINTGQWDNELLELLRIPRAILPEVRNCSEIYGEVCSIPPLAGVPLAGMIGDQQAATFGQLCINPGDAKNTYGTGCFLLMNIGDKPRESQQRLLTTIAWQLGTKTTYALEGSVFIGGAIVQWLRDGLGIINKSSDIQSLATSVEDSGGVCFVPALTGLGAPHWDPYARGMIIGLTRGTTKAHIARAAIEGMAFQVADLVDAMEKDAGRAMNELRADGGAAIDDLLLQFQADILQRPVTRGKVLETTGLGAAYMAGLATGFWKSVDEIASHWQRDRTFEPQMSADQAGDLRANWREAVKRAGQWAKPDDAP